MRCPFANWKGDNLPNQTPNGMIAHMGLVCHIQEGIEVGTDEWFHNPVARASAHFGGPKNGPPDQWVDTDSRAWAEVAGNPFWVSIEFEGRSGDSLTDNQIYWGGRLTAWLHGIYGFPLALTESVDLGGLGWHGMGGAAWGGHIDCPGLPIRGQRPTILQLAAGYTNLGSNPPSTTPLLKQGMPPNSDVHNLEIVLTAWGFYHGPIEDLGVFGPGVFQAVEQFQKTNGLRIDGIVGPSTLAVITRKLITGAR